MQEGTQNLDLKAFIENTAAEFQAAFHVSIAHQAVQALIVPALEHREQVIHELGAGEITLFELREKVFTQLTVAMRIAERRHVKRAIDDYGTIGPVNIDTADAIQSMEEECSYTFWC